MKVTEGNLKVIQGKAKQNRGKFCKVNTRHGNDEARQGNIRQCKARQNNGRLRQCKARQNNGRLRQWQGTTT